MSINVEERVLKIPIPLGGSEGHSVEEVSVQLPPEYPDIERVIYAEGLVNLTEPTPVLGQVVLAGTVDIGLIYQGRSGDKPTLHRAEFPQAADFSIPVELAEVTPETVLKTFVNVESVTAALEKNRSINCSIILEYELETAHIEETNVLTSISGVDSNVIVSSEPWGVEVFIGQAQMRKTIESVLNLGKTDPPIGDLLRVSVKPRVVSARCLAGQALIEGELDCELLYAPTVPVVPSVPVSSDPEELTPPEESDDFLTSFSNPVPEPPLVVKKDIVGFSKFVLSAALATINPEMRVEAQLYVVGLQVLATASDKVEVAVTLNAKARIYEDLVLDVITAVDTDGEERIDLNRRILTVPENVAVVVEEVVTTGTPGIPAAKAELKEILLVQAKPVVTQCRLVQNKVTVAGRVPLSILYIGENELGAEVLDFLEIEKGFEFKETIEVPGAEPGMLVKVEPAIATVAVQILDPFTLEANILVSLSVEVADLVEKEVVMEAAVAVSAPQDGASIRVVVVQHGDTLWKLARRYGTSMEFLVNYNNLGNVDSLAVGQRIRIPTML